jgi:hypothetical protein
MLPGPRSASSAEGLIAGVKPDPPEQNAVAIVARWTGIPVSWLLEGETEKLIHMEERLHERVIGQDAAIEAIPTALRRSRGTSGPEPPDRHIPVPRRREQSLPDRHRYAVRRNCEDAMTSQGGGLTRRCMRREPSMRVAPNQRRFHNTGGSDP